jgi:hypothetical protein
VHEAGILGWQEVNDIAEMARHYRMSLDGAR